MGEWNAGRHRAEGERGDERRPDLAEDRRVRAGKFDGIERVRANRRILVLMVRTIHSAQGATCDRVMAHFEAFRANTVDARSVYVAISRARHGAAVYIDSRTSLTDALGIRDGSQVGTIDEAVKMPGMGIE